MEKIVGLIGYPLDHSWSPSYFRQQFQSHGLENFSYLLFPLESLDNFFPLLERTPNLCGLNVTIPHKESILPYLDSLDTKADEIGAVNTVLIHGLGSERKLTGYNTDAEGFIRSADFSGHRSALVLGTGGASKAVTWALKRTGINYTLVSRVTGEENTIGYSDVNAEILENHSLIINTSPLGMYPTPDSFPPLPYHLITPRHFLYDLVYNPEETLFIKYGREKGARVQSGLKMLHLQAEMALQLFLDAGS